MELKFLGRGAAFNILEGNTNAYFIEDEKLFLVDCGETAFHELAKRNILSKVKEVYAVISHTHTDHCGSIGSIGLYCQHVYHTKLKIIVPHEKDYIEQLDRLMYQFGNSENSYEFVYEEEVDGKFKAFNQVRYELTLHYNDLICHSFVFETNEGAIFYSADTRTMNNLNHFIETHENIKHIYMEVTDLLSPEDVHMNLDVFDQAINKEVKDKVIMMHFRNDECMKKVIDYGYKIVDCNK